MTKLQAAYWKFNWNTFVLYYISIMWLVLSAEKRAQWVQFGIRWAVIYKLQTVWLIVIRLRSLFRTHTKISLPTPVDRLRWRKLRCISISQKWLSQNVNFALLCSLWHHNRDHRHVAVLMNIEQLQTSLARADRWNFNVMTSSPSESCLLTAENKIANIWLCLEEIHIMKKKNWLNTK